MTTYLQQLSACLFWLRLGSNWNRPNRRRAGFRTPLAQPKEHR